jgi:hypothetical protein
MIRVEVVHRLPGRLRLRADALCHQIAMLRRIEQDLAVLPGVVRTLSNETTGSLLIEFDPALQDEATLLRYLADHHVVMAADSAVTQLDPPDTGPVSGRNTPRLATAIQSPFESVNERLFDLTDGYLDLRYSVPVLFAVLGTWKVLSSSALPSIPWFTYYWMSFRLFTVFRGLEKKNHSSGNNSSREASPGAIATG